MSSVEWVVKEFHDLTPFDLYKILRLRSEVFVVEQNCVFQDADNYDQGCLHLLGFHNDELIAYARLVPAGHIYQQASIGRVVTSPAHRGLGAGRKLITEAIIRINTFYGNVDIKIGAQLYLKLFYASFGFAQTGDEYDEDGIRHIHMIRSRHT